MAATHHHLAHGARALFVALILTFAAVASGALTAAVIAADESAEPAASAQPGEISTKTACESADDLRLIVGFLGDTSISEDGVLPVFVGAIAGLSEARELAGLVGETYQPLVEDLIVSLQGLRDIADQTADAETLGASVATLGETITGIGEAMDALTLQLRERCPTDE